MKSCSFLDKYLGIYVVSSVCTAVANFKKKSWTKILLATPRNLFVPTAQARHFGQDGLATGAHYNQGVYPGSDLARP